MQNKIYLVPELKMYTNIPRNSKCTPNFNMIWLIINNQPNHIDHQMDSTFAAMPTLVRGFIYCGSLYGFIYCGCDNVVSSVVDVEILSRYQTGWGKNDCFGWLSTENNVLCLILRSSGCFPPNFERLFHMQAQCSFVFVRQMIPDSIGCCPPDHFRHPAWLMFMIYLMLSIVTKFYLLSEYCNISWDKISLA